MVTIRLAKRMLLRGATKESLKALAEFRYSYRAIMRGAALRDFRRLTIGISETNLACFH
jgi:hypothetical protein